MGKRFLVRLTADEYERATRLVASPRTPTRRRHWMSILLAANEGYSDQEVASRLALSVTTVQRTRQRYAQKGFASFLSPDELATNTTNVDDWSSYRVVLMGTCAIDGFVGAVLVDSEREVCLAGQTKQLGALTLANAALVRSALSQSPGVDEILVTEKAYYHLLRIVSKSPVVYLNVVVDREHSNLALARYQLDTLLNQTPLT